MSRSGGGEGRSAESEVDEDWVSDAEAAAQCLATPRTPQVCLYLWLWLCLCVCATRRQAAQCLAMPRTLQVCVCVVCVCVYVCVCDAEAAAPMLWL